ncbi:MAG: hypothetical protein FJW39_14685 [Acidobacteria bacterium]|nr:hypothetical protein [Acidobacteriota bacterium]
MDFLIKPEPRDPRSVGIFPGSFHPVTRAHEALAQAALREVDIVIFAMPRRFPHKRYEGVGLEQRMAIAGCVARGCPRSGAAITEGGLFIDMAREARVHYPEAAIWILCGRDAAERIVGWTYDGLGIEEQLREYGLLVAARQGEYAPPERLRERIRPLAMAPDWDALSATEVRARMESGGAWEELVPECAVEAVRETYLPSRKLRSK